MVWLNKEGIQNIMTSCGEEAKDSYRFQAAQKDEVL